jgi:AcrR family transcriptional regulator
MARKRSRSATEQRFQGAVLDLVADSGCTKLGVNAVAERAGSDKVLIYRYFSNFDGLLQRVADSRLWLPSADELLNGPHPRHPTPAERLKSIFRRTCAHLQGDTAVHQVARWRHVVRNPLTVKFTEEWRTLWKELAEALSRRMPYEDRKKWARAVELLAIMTDSKISGERVDENWIDFLSEGLEPAELELNVADDREDMLPTNLL